MEVVSVESILAGEHVFGGPMLKRVTQPETMGPPDVEATAHRVTSPATSREAADQLFDELFTRYHSSIYGYILGMVGNPEQAQDLTQDTFVKAYKALPGARDLTLPAWLYRIATNTALD